MANLDPRGMVAKIYKVDYETALHTQYKSSGPHGFREDFLCYSYCKSMRANDPLDVAKLDPRGMIGRIYEGYH